MSEKQFFLLKNEKNFDIFLCTESEFNCKNWLSF